MISFTSKFSEKQEIKKGKEWSLMNISEKYNKTLSNNLINVTDDMDDSQTRY